MSLKELIDEAFIILSLRSHTDAKETKGKKKKPTHKPRQKPWSQDWNEADEDFSPGHSHFSINLY